MGIRRFAFERKGVRAAEKCLSSPQGFAAGRILLRDKEDGRMYAWQVLNMLCGRASDKSIQHQAESALMRLWVFKFDPKATRHKLEKQKELKEIFDMKRLNKKGFTLVELVIVIAVIAILAAVLIPTFSGVIEKANKNACLQAAKNAYTEVMAKDLADGTLDGKENGTDIAYDTKITEHTINDGKTDYASFVYNNGSYTATYNGSSWTVTKN